jgi:hypothetical protein
MFTNLIAWLRLHPLTITLVLFTIGCLVSLYATEIKDFIRHYPKNRFRSYVVNDAKRRLELLRSLHNNSYSLLLYIASALVEGVWFAFYVQIGYSIISASLFHSPSPSWSLFIGGLVGTVIKLRLMLRELRDYEHSVDHLSRLVQTYEASRTSAQADDARAGTSS